MFAINVFFLHDFLLEKFGMLFQGLSLLSFFLLNLNLQVFKLFASIVIEFWIEFEDEVPVVSAILNTLVRLVLHKAVLIREAVMKSLTLLQNQWDPHS